MDTDTPRAFLMDIGNVLLKVDIAGIARKLAELGINPQEVSSSAFHLLAGKYEEGLVSTEQFIAEGCLLTGLDAEKGGDREKFVGIWNAVFENNAAIEMTVRACRLLKETAGVRLALFSNTNELHVRFMLDRYPQVVSLFDDAVYSHVTGAMKPKPPMYLEAVERLGLEPARTLYFDDKPENIETGVRMGFLGHVFDYTRPETFLDALPAEWRRQIL